MCMSYDMWANLHHWYHASSRKAFFDHDGTLNRPPCCAMTLVKYKKKKKYQKKLVPFCGINWIALPRTVIVSPCFLESGCFIWCIMLRHCRPVWVAPLSRYHKNIVRCSSKLSSIKDIVAQGRDSLIASCTN